MKLSDNEDWLPEVPIVVCLSFCGRDIAQGFHQALDVEPRHPFQRSQFDGIGRFPGTTSMDDFGLVQSVDRLGQSILTVA